MAKLTDDLFPEVAARFKVLAEPARLKILDALRAGERSVGQLGEHTGLNQANLSKHLQMLHRTDFVTRRKQGLFVYYELASDDVFELCDIMCGRIAPVRRRTGAGSGRTRPRRRHPPRAARRPQR
jgi:ArsR family transcriptional regulator